MGIIENYLVILQTATKQFKKK